MLLKPNEVKITKVSEKDGIGVFTFTPLPAGFGHTLGNSLRRVLLTSLEGAAIMQVKFPGVAHQFTTIPGVREDVVELSLNLKQVVVKSHSANVIFGKISKKGPGVVTAGDIEFSSEVEVINKDLHIAEVSGKTAKFDAEVAVGPGVGYSPAEDRNTSEVGVILLDALYSPVLNVSYAVESTRKGDVTGLDKLTLTIKTNGAVTPADALEEGATLIRNFFSKFARGEDPIEAEIAVPGSGEGDSSSEDVYLEDLPLPTRTINALKKQGITTLGQLGALSGEELADIKNLGDKSIKEIEKLLKKEGLTSAA